MELEIKKAMIEDRQNEIHTSLPAIVKSVDYGAGTCTVEIIPQRVLCGKLTKYPTLIDVKLDFKFTKEEKALELQKVKYLEKDEIPGILKKIKNNKVRSIAVLQLHTGLRIGEALALTPDDVDFKNKTISITKTKLRNGDIGSPKTLSSIRTIEISDFIAKLLLDFISNKEFIFKITYKTITRHLQPLNINSHIFRHTHVALLIEENIPIKVISERLGHSDINTTLSIYTHVTKNMKINLRNKLDNLSPFIPHS